MSSPGTCPLCRSTQSRLHLRDGDWYLMRCKECAHVYLANPPSESSLLAEVYNEHYWSSATPALRGYADYFADDGLHLETMRRRVDMLGIQAGERTLDVGCASGLFLAAARERGAEVEGVEPSTSAALRARMRLGGARIHQGVLATRPDDGTRFDWITFVDSLEHLHDPLAALVQARGLLKPAGRLAILTQDVSSWTARGLGARWHHYKQPEHLHHFSPRTLRRALDVCGYEVEHLTRTASGKYVTKSFVTERVQHIQPWLAPVLRPLCAFAPERVWADLRDSFWCIAAPQKGAA